MRENRISEGQLLGRNILTPVIETLLPTKIITIGKEGKALEKILRK